MKTIFNILFGSALLLGFSQCASCKETSYTIQTNTPFSIEKATYTDWVSGVKGGGSGTNVILTIKDIDSKNVVIDSIYFRGRKAKVEIKGSSYIGRFNSSLNQKRDKVLHSDSQKEYGNQVPIIEKEFPFELKKDESVIGYKERGKLKFHKIQLQKEKEQILE